MNHTDAIFGLAKITLMGTTTNCYYALVRIEKVLYLLLTMFWKDGARNHRLETVVDFTQPPDKNDRSKSKITFIAQLSVGVDFSLDFVARQISVFDHVGFVCDSTLSAGYFYKFIFRPLDLATQKLECCFHHRDLRRQNCFILY